MSRSMKGGRGGGLSEPSAVNLALEHEAASQVHHDKADWDSTKASRRGHRKRLPQHERGGDDTGLFNALVFGLWAG